jgi:hypothetical protein
MLRLVCLFLVFGAASGFQQDTEREKDVYRIYSLIFTSPGTSHGPDKNPRYLIAEKTLPPSSLPPLGCVSPPANRTAEFQEVVADYEKRKNSPRTLKRNLSLAKPYDLLNQDEVTAFREARFSGTRPDPRFENVTDLLQLGDVYFSRNGKLALSALSTYCGGLCGQWRWNVLEKTPEGEWRELEWVTCSTMA